MRNIIFVIVLVSLAFGSQLKSQSNYIRLTEDPDIDTYPVFSPKGDKIYFHSTRNSNKKTFEYCSIWMMNNDGTEETEIIKINPPLSAGAIYPSVSISNNSDIIFFKEINNLWEVFMIDLSQVSIYPEIKYKMSDSEGKFKELLEVPGGNACSNVIYNPITDEVFWVANLSSSGFPYMLYSIRKAKMKVLNGQSTMTAGIEIYRTSEKGLLSLHRSHPISLSPDYNKLVVAMIIDSNGCNKCQKDLYILDANTGTIIKQLTSDGANRVSHEDPCWSPDGQWISFTSNLDGSNSIWIIRPDGTDLIRLTSETTNDYAASWSPDSKRIAFTSVNNDNNHDIYIIDIPDCLNIINYSTGFDDIDKLKLVKDAEYNEANLSLTLTPSANWKGGAVWYKEKVPVKKGFTTEFSFKISDGFNKYHQEIYPGADGLAFIIQNYQPDVIGSLGGSSGFRNIPNSIALEFDTYYNDSSRFDNFHDPNENHIGVFSNGIEKNKSDHASNACIGTNDSILPLIPDGRRFYSKVDYNYSSRILTIWLDSNNNFTNDPVLIINNIDISQLLNLDSEEFAWVGFTSATGIVYEKHELLSWSFCSKPTNAVLIGVDEKIPNPENSLKIYPNPAYDIINIEYTVDSPGYVTLELFDMIGNQLTDFESEYHSVGKYSKQILDGTYSSGLYYIILRTAEASLCRKFSIIR